MPLTEAVGYRRSLVRCVFDRTFRSSIGTRHPVGVPKRWMQRVQGRRYQPPRPKAELERSLPLGGFRQRR